MTAKAHAWDRYWFGPGSLSRLAAWRVLLMAMALYALYFHQVTLHEYAGHGGAGGVEGVNRRWTPIYGIELLGIGPPSVETVRVLRTALLASIVCGALGFMTRIACLSTAVLALLWVGMSFSFGKPHHQFHVLALALFALPLAPVGARWSIDALLWRRARHAGGDQAPWAALPLRFAQVSIVLAYFFAGSTKLVIGGLEWMNGLTMQRILNEFHAPLTDLIADQRWLLVLMSASVLWIQVGAPLALFWRPYRWVAFPAAAAFHIGSDLTMETGPFFALWMMMASFVEFERVPGYLRERLSKGGLVRRALALTGTVAAVCVIGHAFFRFVPEGWALLSIPLLAVVYLGRRRTAGPPASTRPGA